MPDSSNTPWTPGPWEKEPNAGRGAWVKGATGEWTALSCGNTDDSARANAALITAAPDFAAAAANLLADVRSRHPDQELHCPHMRALDAALAKARGD